jgi:hypothetical protein
MRHSRGSWKLLAVCVLGFGAAACRSQLKAKASLNTAEAEAQDDRKWETPEPPSAPSDAPATPAKSAPRVAAAVAPVAPSGGVPFLGVVHDLSLAPGAPRAEVCRCLAVAFGAPSDGKFRWQAGPPTTDHDTIAIAIATDGVSCSSGAPPVRASISAVEREGADIVVVVENVREGRPIMRGVLAAPPGANGAITVRTRHDTPYPAASGTGPCRIALK